MIQVWRLCLAAHQSTAFSGEGARQYGGRWNEKGRAVIYTAATQSLAMLEILVHADSDLLANEFAAFAIEIPDGVFIEHARLADLPGSWREESPSLACRSIGNAWLEQARSVALAVPSAIVPAETNYLLNPAHSDFPKLKLGAPLLFRFDSRLGRRESAE